MDAFEQLIAEIFWKEGYWVQTSVKVDLSKEQKRALGNPSMPRPEIDVLAYRGRDNVLKVIECKSYLDSPGVRSDSFDGTNLEAANRYKIFGNDNLRKMVFDCLRHQLASRGACPEDVDIKLCLACGRIKSDGDRQKIKAHFIERGWELFDEPWLDQRLRSLAKVGYENQIATIVAKMLLRGKNSLDLS